MHYVNLSMSGNIFTFRPLTYTKHIRQSDSARQERDRQRMLSKVAALSSLPAGSLTTAGVRQQKIIEKTQRQHDVKDKHKSNVKTNTLSLGGSQKLQPLANRPQRSTNNASTSCKSRPLFESILAGQKYFEMVI